MQQAKNHYLNGPSAKTNSLLFIYFPFEENIIESCLIHLKIYLAIRE